MNKPPVRSHDLLVRRRHLPHWQVGGSIYFVTFRSLRGALPDIAKHQVRLNALHDHGKKHDLHFGVVMPDHVHMLIEPKERAPGEWYDLSEIMKGIKGVSSRRINQLLGTSGTVWQDESYDRVMRDKEEYLEKWNYMWNNPLTAGLASRAEDYEFYIFPEVRPQDSQTRVSGPPEQGK
ncbi:MAG: transposase [Gemmataceae bacterium]|nr:transposase [Gemmataceae bacterium]